MSQSPALPHWQLDSIFPGLDTSEFRSASERFRSDLRALEERFARNDVRALPLPADATDEIPTRSVDEGTGDLADASFRDLNALYASFAKLNAYLSLIVATDAFDDLANAEWSRLKPFGSRLSVLAKRFTAWLGSFEADPLLEVSEEARRHEYLVRRSREDARHMMSDDAEVLASALSPTSGGAWSKLHGDLISRTTIRVTLPGRPEAEYPLTELKNLQMDARPDVRRAAYDAELELLGRNDVAFAAAMNALKGQVNELTERRGWPSALRASLHDSAIGEATLEAMHGACRESFPDFRRYLLAKARFLGRERLRWFDLFAPVSAGESRSYDWPEAQAFITRHFARYSPRLAAFAKRTFDEGWHDVPPRRGKTNGAFCAGVYAVKESRILLNYGATLDDLFTVAHELGHAYHNDCHFRFGRSLMQASTPMTLAETASIFCETIVVNAILEDATPAERLEVLEQDLSGATQLVVDIHSRFLFERAVFERRRERTLSITELNELMLEAQAETYGTALEPDARHPMMWAHKGHYYSASRSFYNYPYTFGYLFGLGLYARYRAEPEGFVERYDRLLASTGMADARTLASEFGIDLEDTEFWRDGLSIARARVAEFERLVEEFSA